MFHPPTHTHTPTSETHSRRTSPHRSQEQRRSPQPTWTTGGSLSKITQVVYSWQLWCKYFNYGVLGFELGSIQVRIGSERTVINSTLWHFRKHSCQSVVNYRDGKPNPVEQQLLLFRPLVAEPFLHDVNMRNYTESFETNGCFFLNITTMRIILKNAGFSNKSK